MTLDAIGIVSRNIAESVRFYALLGVDIKEAGGADHYEGVTSNGVRLMLDSVALTQSINPNWKQPTGIAIVLCFKQDSPAKVDEVHQKITAAGFKSSKAPWDAFWGQRYASVLDPDGNQIDLFAAIEP